MRQGENLYRWRNLKEIVKQLFYIHSFIDLERTAYPIPDVYIYIDGLHFKIIKFAEYQASLAPLKSSRTHIHIHIEKFNTTRFSLYKANPLSRTSRPSPYVRAFHSVELG